MKIFRLERHSAFVDWEEVMNIIVIAQNEDEARMRAYLHFEAYEYAHELLDPDKCACTVIPFNKAVIAMEFKSA